MAPVKPVPQPALTPIPAAPRPAAAPSGDSFKPGLDVRPVSNGHQPSQSTQPVSAQSGLAQKSADGARQAFSLQALSAYAGLLVGSEEVKGQEGVAASTASKRSNGLDAPPPPPGSTLDIKV